MKTETPVDTVTQFVNAMNQGDLATALRFYEPAACFVVQPGIIVNGQAAIGEALGNLLALKPALQTEAYTVVSGEDIALYCARWSMRGVDPAGHVVEQAGYSADILRRQPDGNWLIAVDNPFGSALVE